MGVRQLIIANALAVCALTSCAPKITEKGVVQECVLPSDQQKTLAGRWALAPIPIAVQAGSFSAQEIAAIQGAADTWNTFTGASLKVAILDYGTKESYKVENRTPASGAEGSGPKILFDLGGGPVYKGSVAIFKKRSWPKAYPPETIAITTGGWKSITGGLKDYYAASVELNYENFFEPGLRKPDLQSIITHELGHLVGLDHSCGAPGVTGFPNCGDQAMNPDYATAVMFPKFYFDSGLQGEVKRDLTANDQGRANCLYLPTSGP